MKRVTADSNILISAFLRGGKPLELLELARAGQIELSVSDPILDETARVLKDSSTLRKKTSEICGGSSWDSRSTLLRPKRSMPSCAKTRPMGYAAAR